MVARQIIAFSSFWVILFVCILLKEILGQTRDKCCPKFGILDICRTSTNCVCTVFSVSGLLSVIICVVVRGGKIHAGRTTVSF